VVDTLHWSGGNTSLDAIAAGTPMVTMPGRFMRGRQSAAMLQALGVDELVAGSESELAGRAIEVANDQERNRALRERIARGRTALFDRPEPVAAFSQALLDRAAR
jgi:predicted O-linked N-acetylglucosamine transferase (SPINDLY family)